MPTEIMRTLPEWISIMHKFAFPNKHGVTAFELVPDKKLKRPCSLVWKVPQRFDAANDN